MKVLFDTNVIVDVLQSREPWREDAEQLFLFAAQRLIVGCGAERGKGRNLHMSPEMIAAVSSIMLSIFTLVFTVVTNRKQAVLQSLTSNRMDWIKDVRGLLGDFAHYYRIGDTGKMTDTVYAQRCG